MILPTSYTLSSQALDVGRQPVASGGSGDVYEGSLHGSKVCVKRVRVYSKDGPQKATKVIRLIVSLSVVADEIHRLSTRRPSFGNAWNTRTSFLSSVSLQLLSNSFRNGCPAET